MKVKYKKGKYILPLKYALRVLYLVNLLKIKRILRLGKRIFIYSSVVLPAIFILAICIIIIYCINYNNEYTSFFDTIWQLKNIIIVSIVIVFTNYLTNNEKKRHESLIFQYALYTELMFIIEQYVTTSFICENYIENETIEINNSISQNSILLTEENYKYFINQLDNHKKTIKDLLALYRKDDTLIHKQFKSETKILTNEINIIEYQFITNRFVGIDINDIMDEFNELKIDIDNHPFNEDIHSLNEKDILNWIKSFLRTSSVLLAQLRHPWRWDISKNTEIRDLIYKYGSWIESSIYDNTLNFINKSQLENSTTIKNNNSN